MSLPPGFLDELRARLSLAQVVGRKVMWDQRKSNQAKGDLWAPCPFHQEKTASFHVDDRKGFYYCFGCHAKGDAISFVRETENVEFMEAIRILAGEAGMPMPERDPQAQAKADRRSELAEVMEQAQRWFALQLRSGAGGEARDYLSGRGLGAEACERWGIGFAPPGWEGLREALTGRGITPQDLIDAGLAKASDKGRAPYDTFRNRIMFPIRDPRGRVIAFGGRAMDPSDSAKYLNSPETILFDKSRTLYNHGPAREAAGKGAPLVVAEGYMDVIALAEGGFPAAVAPLGTAVTEHQLAMLWRIAPEPVIALDGDQAGLRAAMRVVDLALPLLEAGQSLRFALMPEGMDPDDVLKGKGRAAMQGLIDGAMPMVQLLWQRETAGRAFDSPERKAALDKALREKIALIRDPSIRNHYGQAIKDLRWDLFRARAPAKGGPRKGRWGAPPGPQPSLRQNALATGAAAEDALREAVILATLLATPAVLHDFEGALERMDSRVPAHARLKDAILRHADAPDLRAAVAGDLGEAAVEDLTGQPHLQVIPSIRRAGEAGIAAQCLAEEFAKLDARRGHPLEVREGEAAIAGAADEHLTWRLARAARAIDPTVRPEDAPDDGAFEKSENGVLLSREERGSFADLLSRIRIEKPKRGPR